LSAHGQPSHDVTGGTAKVGQAVLRHLVDRGYDVVNVDVRSPAEPVCRCLTADLTDLGQVIDAADDTSSNLPTRELIRRFLPGVKDIRQQLTERAALISNRRAKELLGWKQRFFLL
jgi:NAD(P)-dependent dehydrogenase (short-subunit alcohol dehydrogenase family)